MRVEELFIRVRHTLQDNDKAYWTDSELLDYYNECRDDMFRERKEEVSSATLILDPLKKEYDTSGIMRFISAKDDEDNDRPIYGLGDMNDLDVMGIEIVDYNKIKVNDPTVGSSIEILAVVKPRDSNLDNSVRVGDESAIKNYVLSKAYEKDTDMQNFGKAQYFNGKYMAIFKDLKGASAVGYRAKNEETTKSYFY